MAKHPDWVVLGARDLNGYTVFASSTLNATRLERVMQAQGIIAGRPQVDFTRYELSTVMAEITIGEGATYAEAMADLATKWQPDQATEKQPGLPPSHVHVIETPTLRG